MEKDLIKIIEEKIENLEQTKSDRVKEMAKEQKLDVAYETLTKHKDDALKEIESNGAGSKEASEDLEKIESELEKVNVAMSEIEKNIKDEITTTKRNLTEVKGLIVKKEEAQKNKENADKELEKLKRYKEEALAEIENNGAGSKEASTDLGKIEIELEEKTKIKEENEKTIEQCDKKINKYMKKYNTKDSVEENLNKDKDETIKENEEQLNKDKDEVIKENEEQLSEDKNEVIKENEEQLNKDRDKVLKENEESKKTRNQEKQINNNYNGTTTITPKNVVVGNSERNTKKTKITIKVDKNKLDINNDGDLFYKEARNYGKKSRRELDKNNLFYGDKKNIKNLDYALLYAIKEVNSDLVQDYLNVIKGESVGEKRYEESKKRLTDALDIEYKFDEKRSLFKDLKEKRAARNAKKIGIASLEGISEKGIFDKIKEKVSKFKDIKLLNAKKDTKALTSGVNTRAQEQKQKTIGLINQDRKEYGIRDSIKVDNKDNRIEENAQKQQKETQEQLGREVSQIIQEDNESKSR